jgi:chitin disaccharide deacetylase
MLSSGDDMGASDRKRCMVVNGDDFGFSSGVNQAIIQAHEHGILTSASLMVTGAALDEAVELARSHPNLGVGLHVVLTCGRSRLPPVGIPQLVNSRGEFSTNPTIAGLIYQFHPFARQQLHAEIRAQLEGFRETGLPLSHVDGHLHLHCHPVVLSILAELAPEFGIRTIRLPFEELHLSVNGYRPANLNKVLLWGVFAQLRRMGIKILRSQNIHYLERVYGLLHTDQITEAYLLQLIPTITANCVELYAHPAISLPGEPFNGKTGQQELAALISPKVRHALIEYGFELTNFRMLQGS